MRPDEDREMEGFLLRLANSISDGSDVDWSEAESSTDSEQREMVRQLKALAEIAAVHRGLQSSAGPGVSLESTSPGLPRPQGTVPPAEAPPWRWGHLEIIDRVGTGSYGAVYRARDTVLDSEVALKLLRQRTGDQSDRETRVIEEARLLARVQHSNVVRVYGAERHEGRVGIWMEFIPGRNLEQILEESGRRGASEAIDIGCDLCRALAAVHQAGVIHRDIKTKNVMREEGGRLVLMDFGSGSSTELEEKAEIGVAGTPLYMAPELLAGGQATARSDIYSLGVLLYHLVTASYPVKAADLAGLRQAHEMGDRELLGDLRPDLHPGFIRVVEKALEPDPSRRYQTPGRFEKALAGARGEKTQSEDDGALPLWPRFLAWCRAQPRAIQALIPAVVVIAIIALSLPPIIDRFWPPTYTVQATIYRSGDPAMQLRSGETISVGDELFIRFEGSRELFVYVINHDEIGESYLLFPISDSRLKNPLPPGSHRLPGPRNDHELNWTVTSEGGREHIVIITSPERLIELEAEMQSLDHPHEIPETGPGYLQMSVRASALLTRGITRGIGGIVERPSESVTPEKDGALVSILDTIYELTPETEKIRGTWVRQIDLVHQPSNP